MGNKAASHLRPEAVSDLENTTEFTAEEIRDFYRQFRSSTSGQMDLSKEEFVAAYSKLFPKGDAAKFAEHVFRNYDRDGSGNIGNLLLLNSICIFLIMGSHRYNLYNDV